MENKIYVFKNNNWTPIESNDSKKELEAHESNKNNPHGVTKTQVGLGSVSNYGLATKVEAEAGASNAKYMTPLRTKEAIDSILNTTYGNKIVDTRDLNLPPKDYPVQSTHNEFKRANTVGLNTLGASTYVHLFTESSWKDDTGGYVHQMAYDGLSNKIWTRIGSTRANSWESWSELELTEGAQIKANKALADAKAYTDTKTTNMETLMGSQSKNLMTLNQAKSYTDTKFSEIKPAGYTRVTGVKTPANYISSGELPVEYKEVGTSSNWSGMDKIDGEVYVTTIFNKINGVNKITQTVVPSNSIDQNMNIFHIGSANFEANSFLYRKIIDSNEIKNIVNDWVERHNNNKANPHGVTKAQVGLGSVDNAKQMPISGGTFTGIAKAQNNANYTVAQLRNVIYMEDTGEEPSNSIGNNGDMLIIYEGGS